MIRCARCGRKVAKPVLIAGVKLGPSCAKTVDGVVRQRRIAREKPEPDPRQTDLFVEAA